MTFFFNLNVHIPVRKTRVLLRTHRLHLERIQTNRFYKDGDLFKYEDPEARILVDRLPRGNVPVSRGLKAARARGCARACLCVYMRVRSSIKGSGDSLSLIRNVHVRPAGPHTPAHERAAGANGAKLTGTRAKLSRTRFNTIRARGQFCPSGPDPPREEACVSHARADTRAWSRAAAG